MSQSATAKGTIRLSRGTYLAGNAKFVRWCDTKDGFLARVQFVADQLEGRPDFGAGDGLETEDPSLTLLRNKSGKVLYHGDERFKIRTLPNFTDTYRLQRSAISRGSSPWAVDNTEVTRLVRGGNLQNVPLRTVGHIVYERSHKFYEVPLCMFQ